MEAAPYYAIPKEEPVASTYWVFASDGVRLRVGAWDRSGAKGTVLLFPGRTEYIEKYAITAGEFAERGYATLAIDWRGQGLADRLQPNKTAGHIGRFLDYQLDVKALIKAAEDLRMPKPYFLLGHSMGGAIGLRALCNNLPVNAAAFTGPMWQIRLGWLRGPAYLLSAVLRGLGMGNWLTPGKNNEAYVLDVAFEDNLLTKDRGMYARLQAQARAHPELSIGGPSIRWANEALRECYDLTKQSAPAYPSLTFVGTDERVVDINAIQSRVDGWPNAELEWIEAGEHEVLMEGAHIRQKIMDQITALFDDHS